MQVGLLWCFGGVGDLAHPVLLGSVVNLGVGAQLLEQPEAVGALRGLGGLAGGVVEVAEPDSAGGAGLHASRHVIAGLNLFHAGRRGALFSGMPAAVAEVALLDHAAHTGRDVGIERLLHAGGPHRVEPVEIARVVWAGRHAVAAAETAFGHLAHDAGPGVDVHCLLRAHAGAWRMFTTMLAKHGHEGRPLAGIFLAILHLVHADPGDALALIDARVGRRNVVLHGAGHHAGAAAVAAIDVDRHAVFPGDHMRTTFAPVDPISASSATRTTPGRTLESTVTSTGRFPFRVSRTARAPSATPLEAASLGWSAMRLGASRRLDSWRSEEHTSELQ